MSVMLVNCSRMLYADSLDTRRATEPTTDNTSSSVRMQAQPQMMRLRCSVSLPSERLREARSDGDACNGNTVAFKRDHDK